MSKSHVASLTPGATTSDRSYFWQAKVASLFGIVPLGVFVVVHLYNNLSAFYGAATWEKNLTHDTHPLTMLLTMVVVVAPLIIHSLWGIARTIRMRNNWPQYGYLRNFRYLLQRITAVGALAFLVAHMWLAWIRPRFVEGHGETFADISAQMHWHLPTLIVYVLGTAGIAYHLANGISTALMGFGVTATKDAKRKLDWVAYLILVILLAMSWGAIYALWLGAPATPPANLH